MSEPSTAHETGGPAFWVAVGVGAALIAWGVYLFLESTPDWGRRVNFAVFVGGAAIAHDALLAPVVGLVGLGLAWVLRGRDRRWIQMGLVATGSILLVAWLPLAGTAEGAGNPTIQPLDYRTATLTAVVVVWVGVGVGALVARWYRAR